MAEDFAADAITRLGWRQGSVLGRLLVGEAIRLKPDRVNVEEPDRLIVTSHDCDIANGSLTKEPVVEILRAVVNQSAPDGNHQCGRNPRELHLGCEIDGCQVTDDDLPTVYIGQAEEIGQRIESHDSKKDFWDWGYAFVSSGNALNRAHITWLEHALIDRASKAGRCHLDNANQPKEPGLSESERADIHGFLREMLRTLPLLGVRVFEKPTAVASPGDSTTPAPLESREDARDTVIVPAQQDGFDEVFLGQHCWYAIRIGGGMLPKIKYIAAYQSNPVSAITYYAKVDRIEPYGDEGKYKLIFAEPAKALPQPIPFADATTGSMQGPRHTSLANLLSAKRISDLFT